MADNQKSPVINEQSSPKSPEPKQQQEKPKPQKPIKINLTARMSTGGVPKNKCVVFGHFYRKIRDAGEKQWIGTSLGIVIILFTSKFHGIHVFLTFIFCSVIIKQYKSQCHHICFWFMMAYLMFFRMVNFFGIPTPPGHTNMIQMILTLKIIGLAFERNAVFSKSRDADKNEDSEIVLSAAEKDIQEISIISMFHYCFNYIGLLTGPYFTYKTFFDYFHYPFAANADCWKITSEKLKWVPIYIGLFLGASYIWPLEYATSDEFYQQRSWLYRLFYVWPSFFIFRMRIYSGITLSECVLTCAGFGAYPKELEAKCGHGPSKDITQEFIDEPEYRAYNFETIENVHVAGVEKCWTFREAMKHWNRCIQFWLAMYIYKQFPSKKYRTIATMAVSAYWHGVHAGYYFCILGPIFYLPIEDLYVKLFKDEKAPRQQQLNLRILVWILKFFAFSYMGTAFLLKDVDKIWFYYQSVYHFAYIFWAVLYVVCLFLWKQKKSAMKKAARENEKVFATTKDESIKLD